MPGPTNQEIKVHLGLIDNFTPQAVKNTKVVYDAYGQIYKRIEKVSKVHDKAGKISQETAKKMVAASKKVQQQHKKQADGYVKGVGKMRGHTAGLTNAIGKLRNTFLLVAFAQQTVMRLILPAIKASQVQEEAEARLENTIRGTTGATDAQIRSLKALAKQLQQTTTFGDEQIISAQAMLASFKLNTSEIKRITPRLLDLASMVEKTSGKQADLQEVAKALGKAFTGQTGALSRWGVVLSDSTKKSGGFSAILQDIDANASGLAQGMATTYTGAARQLKNAMGDLGEQVGKIIRPSKTLYKTLKTVTDHWTEWMTELQEDPLETTVRRLREMGEAGKIIIELELFVAEKAVLEKISKLEKERIENEKNIVGLHENFMRLTKKQQETTEKLGYTQTKEMVNAINRIKLLAKEEDGRKKIATFVNSFNEKYKTSLLELAKIQKEDTKSFWEKLITSDKTLQNKKDERDVNKTNLETVLKIAALEYERLGLTTELARIQKALAEQDFKKPKEELTAWIDFLKTVGTEWDSVMSSIETAAEKTSSTIFFDMFMGKSKTFLDYWEQFNQAVLKSFADMLAKMLIEAIKMKLVMAALDLFSFGAASTAGAAAGAGTSAVAGVGASVVVHKGGIAKPQRFASGGVVPALLESGEGVVSRSGMANLGPNGLERINRGGSPTGRGTTINNYYIDAIDVKTFRDYMAENQDLAITAVQGDLEANGVLRRQFKGGI